MKKEMDMRRNLEIQLIEDRNSYSADLLEIQKEQIRKMEQFIEDRDKTENRKVLRKKCRVLKHK